jgi:hypothetical protein
MQLSRETQIRIGLILVGGALATITLAWYQIVIVKAPLVPGFTYLNFLSGLVISFLSGIFSVWLVSLRLSLYGEHRSSRPNQLEIGVKKGMAAATLTCFLIGSLLSILNAIARGTIEIEEATLLLYLLLYFDALVHIAVNAIFMGLMGLLFIGLPALIVGAAYGYIAERLTGRLLQLH